jgi:putative transcriptional regulator
MELRNKLKYFRTLKKIDQQYLADKVDILLQTYQAIETGKLDPEAILALKFAQILKHNVEEIFSLEEDDIIDVIEELPHRDPNN